MPLYNPATDSKVCSKCQTEFVTRAEVDKNFFHVQAMRDGWASRCKRCYYQKDALEVRVARNDAAVERKLTKLVAAEPIKDRPASRKAYTHTPAEVKKAEQATGLKFKSWMDCGDCWMPVFGKA